MNEANPYLRPRDPQDLWEVSARRSEIPVSPIERAAINAGNAGAMASNLARAGRHDKAEVWVAECAAWAARKDMLVLQAPLRRSMAVYASELVSEAFTKSLVG